MIKEQIARFPHEIGRMIGIDRGVSVEEQAALYELFVTMTNRSVTSLRFGDFLEWVMCNVTKTHPMFTRKP